MLTLKKPFMGSAYYPEDWDLAQVDYDISMMKKAGLTCARIAEFAWHRMEPRRGEYDFTWLHYVVDKLGAAGIGVILGTPTATPPIWLSKAYPDVLKVNEAGHATSHGGRRHCCSNNPHYLEACDQIVEKMAQEFAEDESVIGWQIDNEIYTDPVGCCCPYCVDRYHARLKQQYGTIEELDRQWDLNLFSQWYDDFEDVPAGHSAWHNPHLLHEWATMHLDADIDFIHRQAEIIRKYSKAPIGTDMMPTTRLSHEKMNEKLDVAMFNHYNTPENLIDETFWFNLMRPLKDRPFWVTETATTWNGGTAIRQFLKPEGYCAINSFLPIALGAESNNYWLWRQHWAGHELTHGSVLSPEGRPTHTFGEVQQTCADYAVLSDFLDGTKVKTSVALHQSAHNASLLQFQKVFESNNYIQYVMNVHHAMTRSGLLPDVIDQKDVSAYKLVFSPMMLTLEEKDLAQRMISFVQDGGTWVVGPLTDVRNEIGAHYLEGAMGHLETLLGITLDYGVPTDASVLKTAWSDGSSFDAQGWCECFTVPENAEVLASVTGGHSSLNGEAVIFRIPYGKGSIIVCGAALGQADLQKLIRLAAEKAGTAPVEASANLIVSQRSGQAGEGIIACEVAHETGRLVLPAPAIDLLSGETCEGEVCIPPYGYRVFKFK